MSARSGSKRWIRLGVCLTILSALALCFVFGYVVHRWRIPPYAIVEKIYRSAGESALLGGIGRKLKDRALGLDLSGEPGLWRKARASSSPGGPGSTLESQMAELAALGYLQGYEVATDQVGVTINRPGLTHDGLNLHSSGHAQEALLMDMEGEILHRWSYEFRDAFEGHPELTRIYMPQDFDGWPLRRDFPLQGFNRFRD